MTHLAEATALGFVAGVLSGLFGVGGGLLFVPTLTLVLGLPQLDAQATSLAAMVPAVALGAWRQTRYGNVDWRAATLVGLASAAGIGVGTLLATSLAEGVLRKLFACVLLGFAAHLAWGARAESRPEEPIRDLL